MIIIAKFALYLSGTFRRSSSLYHDQGLIPLKTLAFDLGVNVTLGLPIIRTSVDHGTAFDLAGQGVASVTSLVEATRLADRMATANSASLLKASSR